MLAIQRASNRKATSGKRSATLDAADGVAQMLENRRLVSMNLADLVYPKMKTENPGGAGGMTLLTIEQLLRTATTPADINQASDLGVMHFLRKSDKLLNLAPQGAGEAKMPNTRRLRCGTADSGEQRCLPEPLRGSRLLSARVLHDGSTATAPWTVGLRVALTGEPCDRFPDLRESRGCRCERLHPGNRDRQA